MSEVTPAVPDLRCADPDASLIQRRFSTAMRRAQTMPPPPPTPKSETARNAVNKAERGTACPSS
jgi:hypothetical protein